MADTVKTDTTLQIDVLLTEPEQLHYSKDMVDAINAKARAEDDLQSYSKQKKADISALEGKINAIAEKLNRGREVRWMDVTVVKDFATKTKAIYRRDTGELVKTDILTEDDLQAQF
jgi:hypothetical protein